MNEEPHIIFPGNLQGRHIGEQGAKGAVLVSVEDGSIVGIDWIYPDVVRWIPVEMDLTSCTNREEALDIFEEMIRDIVEKKADGRTLAVRLSFKISSVLHNLILYDETQFRAELQSLAMGNHREALWIEKVKFNVSTDSEREFLTDHQDAIAELQTMLSQAAEDPELLQKISKDLEVLFSRLPSEVRSNSDLELLNCLKEKKTEKIVEEVTPFLVSSLLELRKS